MHMHAKGDSRLVARGRTLGVTIYSVVEEKPKLNIAKSV